MPKDEQSIPSGPTSPVGNGFQNLNHNNTFVKGNLTCITTGSW